MDVLDLSYALVGVVALLAGLLPRSLASRPLSLPIVFLGLGMVMFLLPIGLPDPDPLQYPDVATRLTELGVIVALMGAGLKLDRRIGWQAWSSTWRLLAVAMPLTTARLGPARRGFQHRAARSEVSPEPAPPRQSTYRHQLATLTVRCVGRTARVLDWQSVPGATVVSTDLGPDEDIHLDLDLDTTGAVVRLEVYGSPTPAGHRIPLMSGTHCWLPPSGHGWSLGRAGGTLESVTALTIRLVSRRHVDLLRICSAMCGPTD